VRRFECSHGAMLLLQDVAVCVRMVSGAKKLRRGRQKRSQNWFDIKYTAPAVRCSALIVKCRRTIDRIISSIVRGTANIVECKPIHVENNRVTSSAPVRSSSSPEKRQTRNFQFLRKIRGGKN